MSGFSVPGPKKLSIRPVRICDTSQRYGTQGVFAIPGKNAVEWTVDHPPCNPSSSSTMTKLRQLAVFCVLPSFVAFSLCLSIG
ncbi:MAG: hypothetical protein VB858_20715, partial [Planctomycetaceae bacterium]